jgi:hypothetical protein
MTEPRSRLQPQQIARPKDNWTYGEEGLAYPVQTGDIWQVGNHMMSCSDLMASDAFDHLLRGYAPTLLFCDPPWGQSLVNSYRTKAGLDKAAYRWESLYRRIANLGHTRGIPVWVEGSKRESRDGEILPLTIALPPGSNSAPHYWPIAYFRNKPAGLYYEHTTQPPRSLIARPSPLDGLDDERIPGVVIGAYAALPAVRPGVVIDPCMGRGGTSRGAEEHGWASVGNEMNPRRLSVALSRLHQITGHVPEKVG